MPMRIHNLTFSGGIKTVQKYLELNLIVHSGEGADCIYVCTWFTYMILCGSRGGGGGACAGDLDPPEKSQK